MKLVVDMNLSPRWAAEFRSRGFDARHWSQIGAATAPDTEVLAWCTAHEHVLLTHDLDFGAILAGSSRRAPSVVQLRADNIVPEAMLGQVIDALRQLAPELAQGALVTIEPARQRVRLLPLRVDSSGPQT